MDHLHRDLRYYVIALYLLWGFKLSTGFPLWTFFNQMFWDTPWAITIVILKVFFACLDSIHFFDDYLIVFFNEIKYKSYQWGYHDDSEYQVADTLRNFSHPKRLIFTLGFLHSRFILGWILLANGFLIHYFSDQPTQVLNWLLVIHILYCKLFLPTYVSDPNWHSLKALSKLKWHVGITLSLTFLIINTLVTLHFWDQRFFHLTLCLI